MSGTSDSVLHLIHDLIGEGLRPSLCPSGCNHATHHCRASRVCSFAGRVLQAGWRLHIRCYSVSAREWVQTVGMSCLSISERHKHLHGTHGWWRPAAGRRVPASFRWSRRPSRQRSHTSVASLTGLPHVCRPARGGNQRRAGGETERVACGCLAAAPPKERPCIPPCGLPKSLHRLFNAIRRASCQLERAWAEPFIWGRALGPLMQAPSPSTTVKTLCFSADRRSLRARTRLTRRPKGAPCSRPASASGGRPLPSPSIRALGDHPRECPVEART